MERLINAIRNDIQAANELANMIEELDRQRLNGEFPITELALSQLNALRNMHNRRVDDIEEKKKLLSFFQQMHNQ